MAVSIVDGGILVVPVQSVLVTRDQKGYFYFGGLMVILPQIRKVFLGLLRENTENNKNSFIYCTEMSNAWIKTEC